MKKDIQQGKEDQFKKKKASENILMFRVGEKSLEKTKNVHSKRRKLTGKQK